MEKSVDVLLKLVQHNNTEGVKAFLSKNSIIGIIGFGSGDNDHDQGKMKAQNINININSFCHQKSGDSALHLASRLGHIDLLR